MEDETVAYSFLHLVQVIALSEMSDGTVVSLRVGNDENFCGELRNNTAVGGRREEGGRAIVSRS